MATTTNHSRRAAAERPQGYMRNQPKSIGVGFVGLAVGLTGIVQDPVVRLIHESVSHSWLYMQALKVQF